jgi:hypothetical protein
VLAFILQLCFEHAPARIENGFGHPSLDEPHAAHIAYFDCVVSIDDGSGKLMQGILSPASRSAVQALCLPLMAATLGLGNLLLNPSIKMTRKELISVARDNRLFQA